MQSLIARIRWRLVGWNVLILGLILVMAGTSVYAAVSRSLLAEVDNNLLARSEQALPFLFPLNSMRRKSAIRASKREAGSTPTIGSCPAGPSTRRSSLCAGFPSSPQIQICSSK